MVEEYNRKVINLKGLIARIIPTKGISRRGDIMAIKKGETITKTSGFLLVTKTGDVMVTRREGATATKSGDAIVTSKTGEDMAEAKETLMATRKEGRTVINREELTVTNREERMVLPIGVLITIGVTTGIEKQALTRVGSLRGNVAQEWESVPNQAKGARVEGITETGEINLSTLVTGRNRETPGKR